MNRLRILMVDDDVDLLMLTKDILQKQGYKIETCSEATRVLDKVRAFDPNLVMLDVFLGNSDGLSICHKLKSCRYTRNIPVVVLSGYAELADTAKYGYGADDFISKPFKARDIVGKINRILTRKGQVH